MKTEHIFKKCLSGLLFITLSNSIWASDTYENLEGVAGNIGQIYVHGTLTESACRIEMDSLDQSVDLGNIETADLGYIGERTRSSKFGIKLKDCISENSEITDFRTGLKTWSTSQPSMKIRFYALQDKLNPNIVQVNGAKGLGLELLDSQGNPIHLGEFSRPTLLDRPQNILSYEVIPVRIGDLEPDAYNAMISFEIFYE